MHSFSHIEIKLVLSEDSPDVVDGIANITILTNDTRVVRMECDLGCNINIQGCIDYPAEDCKFFFTVITC